MREPIERSQPEAPDRAIVADRLVKEFDTEIGTRRVIDGISFRVGMGERMAVLGRNGAGKSTLIQILSGLQRPGGTIHRGLRMSWPLALGGGFEGELTGYDNIRFISRIYNVPFRETYDFVDDFAEIGKQLHTPVRFYSSGMRMRVAFRAVSRHRLRLLSDRRGHPRRRPAVSGKVSPRNFRQAGRPGHDPCHPLHGCCPRALHVCARPQKRTWPSVR